MPIFSSSFRFKDGTSSTPKPVRRGCGFTSVGSGDVAEHRPLFKGNVDRRRPVGPTTNALRFDILWRE